MSNLLKGNRVGLIKTAAVLTAVSTVLSLSAILSLSAFAVVPADYGLTEGWTISAAGSSDPDVYIVNETGYKRLFLNPVIFSMYGHLGGFANVHNVTPATRDAFPTSGLFRNCETGDQKVYGVEVTAEDTGMLHWVNTTGAQAVADDANFFKKVFCINNNEFNWYAKGANYTSVNQVPNYVRVPGATPTPVAGNINVSLASDNPGAASLTQKANGVTFLKLNLSGTGTLHQLKVYRKGPGATGDFSNVYLYDGARRLTSGRTPSSSDGSITFGALNLAVSGTRVISVVADLATAGATAGNVNYFAVLGSSDVVLTSGSVGGSFPINGSNMTVTGQTGGTLGVDKVGSLGNPNVGQSNVELTEFRLTANTEGAKVSRLQLINGGTIQASGITGLRLEVNGVKVADGTMTSDNYAVFDFSSNPYVINKGDNRIFKVYGNLAGKKSETVILYFEQTSDVLALGDQFGFGMSIDFGNDGTGATASGMDTSATSDSHTLTLQGGVLTLSFIGPSASNISTATSKTHFLDFDINSAANIEMKKHTIVLCRDTGGNGTYDAASDTSNGWVDMFNVSIIDRDSGTSIVGPQDGSAFKTSNTSCPGGIAGAAKTFTDTFNISAGETKHLAVVGDIKGISTDDDTATGNDTDLASDTVVKVIIDGYGDAVTSSGDLTVMKYTNTNTAVTSVDIVPSGDIAGNGQTLQGSSLTLALAATPSTGSHSFVKGTSNVTANGFSLTSALGSSLKITNVTLTGYAGDTSAALGRGVAADPDGSVTVGGLASAVRLVDGETGAVISSGPTTNNLSNSTGTAQFSNLNWVIPAGSTKTLLVKTDLSTNATSGSSDVFSFDIAATGDITAIDDNSNTVNLGSGNVAVNASTHDTTYVTVNSAGSLASAAAADAPTSAAVYWGQNAAAFSKFKLTSTNEGFYVERLNLYAPPTSSENSNLVNNIDSVTIAYTNKAGSTVTQTGSFNSNASVSFGWLSGDANRPYVPKDGVMYVTATANMKTAATLYRASDVTFSIDFSAGHDDEFRAVGEGSGAVKQGTDVTTTTGNNMRVYRSFPQFTMLTAPATTIAVGQDIFKFKIDAMGLASDGATVFFDGGTVTGGLPGGSGASGSLVFAVIASGETSNTMSLDLRRVVDSSGGSVDQLVATRSLTSNLGYGNAAAGNTGFASSASFRFQDVSTSQAIEIPAGSSNTFIVRISAMTGFTKALNSTSGRGADYIQLVLRNAADSSANGAGTSQGVVTWTDKGGVDRNNSNISVVNILKSLPMNGVQILRQ